MINFASLQGQELQGEWAVCIKCVVLLKSKWTFHLVKQNKIMLLSKYMKFSTQM